MERGWKDKVNPSSFLLFTPGGGILLISEWGCAARTLEPLAYTRASSAEFILESKLLKSLLSLTSCFPEIDFLTVNNIQ